MLRHIVIWAIKDTTTQQDLEMLKRESETLKDIPTLKSLEFVIDPIEKGTTHDMMLVGVYENEEDLEAYKVHPIHVAFGQKLRPLVKERVAFDYKF